MCVSIYFIIKKIVALVPSFDGQILSHIINLSSFFLHVGATAMGLSLFYEVVATALHTYLGDSTLSIETERQGKCKHGGPACSREGLFIL